jgi:hypothetical protein
MWTLNTTQRAARTTPFPFKYKFATQGEPNIYSVQSLPSRSLDRLSSRPNYLPYVLPYTFNRPSVLAMFF